MFDRDKWVTIIVQQRGLPPKERGREKLNTSCCIKTNILHIISRKLRKWLQDTFVYAFRNSINCYYWIPDAFREYERNCKGTLSNIVNFPQACVTVCVKYLATILPIFNCLEKMLFQMRTSRFVFYIRIDYTILKFLFEIEKNYFRHSWYKF